MALIRNISRHMTKGPLVGRHFSLLGKGLSSVEAEEYLGAFPCVKMRGLPFDVTLDDVCDFLGGIRPVDIVPQMGKGKSKATVAVLFANVNDASAALKLDKKCIGERYIDVFRIRRDEFHKVVSEHLAERAPIVLSRPNMANYEAVLKLDGLSFEASFDDIKRFMSGFDITNDDIILEANQQGNPSGAAYVGFACEKTAAKALKALNRKAMGIRNINISTVNPTEADKVKSIY